MKIFSKLVSAALLAVAGAVSANAAAFQLIRIGDVDGFGYHAGTGPGSPAGGFKAANGSAVDVNNNGVIGAGEYLPDLNKNGILATGQGDDFDNRLAEAFGGTGYALTSAHGGSKGLPFTDIGLSTSYNTSKAANKVFNANTGLYGPGGTFPDANPAALPNQPGFVFDFSVTKADIVAGAPLYFNLIYGDYDVSPANVQLTYAIATAQTIALGVQLPNQDGLVQSASQFVDFYKIFTDMGSYWQGYLKVDFLANNEPYTAFDFVELSRTQEVGQNTPDSGTTLLLLSLVLAGLWGMARRCPQSA